MRIRFPLVTVLTLAFLAPPAALAAPAGFYGVNWDREIARGSSERVAPQYAAMGKAGVESVRTPFFWAEMQADENAPIYFAEADDAVAAAARNGMSLLPTVVGAPTWARQP